MMKNIEGDIYDSFLQYRESLEDYACSLLGSRQDAQDMVQDLYLKLWGRRDTLCEIESPKAYCFSVIRRQCLDVLKSAERKNEAQMPQEIESSQEGIEEKLALREQLEGTLKEVTPFRKVSARSCLKVQWTDAVTKKSLRRRE